MSNLIYNIPNWAVSTNYVKHDIVVRSNLYYYALLNHTSSSNFNNDLAAGKFGGNIINNGENKRQFIWQPAYNFTVESEPKVKKIQFGDGYASRINDGINNLLPIYNLEFQGDTDECSAILHFLESCEGSTSFMWLAPSPRGILSRFVCGKWQDKQNFYNNYSITAQFERTMV